jgi:hypothetical protein
MMKQEKVDSILEKSKIKMRMTRIEVITEKRQEKLSPRRPV